MIKTLNKAISLIVLVVFVLSLVPVVGMAEAIPAPTITLPAYKTAAAAKPWTGDVTPSSNMIGFNANGGLVAVTGSLSSGLRDKITHQVEMQYSYGTFGKLPDDAVYITRDRDTRTTADLTQPGAHFDLGVPEPEGVAFRTSDIAIEFSFAFTDANDKITALTPMYFDYAKALKGTTDGWNTGYKFSITPTSAIFVSSKKAFEKALELNTWHNATMILDVCADSSGTLKPSSYTYKLFIDSELYASHTFNSSNPMYGPRYIRLGLDNVGNSTDTVPDNWTHFDNINVFALPNDGGADYVPTQPTASTFTSNDPKVEIIDHTIVAPKDYTLADVKRALVSSKDNDVIRYYNSDYTAFAEDGDLALGTEIVIASLQDGEETTFANYTVEKFVKKFPDINQNASVFVKGGSTGSFYSITNETNGLGGKAEDDKYIRFADAAGNPYHGIDTDAASGKQDVFEFSVYVPENANGVSVEVAIYDKESSYFTVPVLIKGDGIYTNFSTGANRLHKWEPNKWHHVAIETSKPYTGAVNSDGQSLDSTANNIYIDGVLEHIGNFGCSRAGFRHIRFTSTIQTENDVNAYFDNVRCYSGTYEPQYDALDSIVYKDGIGDKNNIIVKGRTTVGELKTGISCKEDTAIRVYKTLTSNVVLSDGELVDDGYVVVAAAKNDSEMERSYNYYTIDKIKYETNTKMMVNGAEAKLYDADDALSAVSSFSNYTNAENYKVTMYAAQYQYGELIGLWTDTKTAAPGETKTLSCDFAGMTNHENSRIKVILADDDVNPYCAPATMRFNSENTQATLYLLGDSIVQTYVDASYPIQGWGYFIGDYLNDNITVDNRATSGWTTDHYLYPDGIYTKQGGVTEYGTELTTTSGNKKVVGESNRYKTWANILSELKAGDYVMVSLGINDSGSGNVSAERYLENITTIYDQATSKGATVIFSTPTISGKDWNNTSFGESWGGRGEICTNFAKSRGAVCIPLGAELVRTYNAMANEYLAQNPTKVKADANNYVRNYFHMYPVNGTPPEGWNDFGTLTSNDTTHHNLVGSNKVASIIAKLLLESGSPLGDYVVIPQ